MKTSDQLPALLNRVPFGKFNRVNYQLLAMSYQMLSATLEGIKDEIQTLEPFLSTS